MQSGGSFSHSLSSVSSSDSFKTRGADSDDKTEEGATSLLTKDANALDALFGALYTVSKEKYTENHKVSIMNIILDFVQIMNFVITSNYAWDIAFNSVFLRWTARVNLSNWLKTAGYPIFSALFYVLVIALAASVSLCAYVAYNFKTNTFPFVWPIKLLRFFVSIFLDSFYISLLNVFLVGPDCNLVSGYSHNDKYYPKGYSDQYPDKKCFGIPHIFMFVLGTLFTLVAIFTNYLIVVGSTDLDLWASNLQSSLHSNTEVRFWMVRTSITVASVLLSNHSKFQGAWLLINSSVLVYSLLRRAPYLNPYINCFRTALYMVLFWCSLCLVLLLQYPKNNRAITLLMAIGSAVAVPIGWLIMKYRLMLSQHNVWKKFKAAAPHFEKVQHRFFDDYEVEIASRCHRLKTQSGQPDMEWVEVGEAIFRAGLRQFPKSSFLNLSYANFLFSVRNNVKAGSIQLSTARKTKMTLGEKFVVFCRDRERKQRAGGDAGEGNGAMDLVSYVEYQTNMRAIVSSHIAALKAIRAFWRELLKKEVTFNNLSRAFEAMDTTERLAEKGYRMLLERYSKSPKLLRTYGKFLEDVKSDPWAASKYFSESDRLEDIQAEQARDALLLTQGGEGLNFTSGTDVGSRFVDASDAVIVINEAGIVQFVNRQLLKMFGYRKGELEGKNVNLLMPMPFAAHHSGYLRNYMITKKSKVIGHHREVLALHKQRHTFSIKIHVTKLQQSETDAVNFMAVMQKVEDNGEATAWLTTGGLIISSNRAFTDITGFKSVEILGKNFRTLLVNQEEAEVVLKQISELTEGMHAEDLAGIESGERSRVLATFDIKCKHKYGSAPLAVQMTVSLSGTEQTKICICSFKLTEVGVGFIAVNDSGLIQYCSSSIEQMLGYNPGVFSNGSGVSLGKLLPMPYALLHHTFVETFVKTLAQTGGVLDSYRPVSCGSGRIVNLHHKTGQMIPVRLRLGFMKEDDRPLFTASLERAEVTSPWTEHPCKPEDVALEGARLRLLVNRSGTVICSDAPQSPYDARPAHFGIYKEEVEGMNIVDLIDLFADGLQSSLVLQPNTTPESMCPPLLRKLADQMENMRVVSSYRVGVALARGEGFVPAFFVISAHAAQEIHPDRMVDGGLMVDAGWLQAQLFAGDTYVIDLYPTEALLGTIDLDKSGKIRRCDRAASIILGQSIENANAMTLPELFHTPIQPNRINAALGLKLGKSIGNRTTLEVQAPDEAVYPVSVLFAARNEGQRLQGLLYCPTSEPSPQPIGSYRRCQALLYKFATNSMPQQIAHAVSQPIAGAPSADSRVRFTDAQGEESDPSRPASAMGTFQVVRAAATFKSLRAKRASRSSAAEVPSDVGPMGWSVDASGTDAGYNRTGSFSTASNRGVLSSQTGLGAPAVQRTRRGSVEPLQDGTGVARTRRGSADFPNGPLYNMTAEAQLAPPVRDNIPPPRRSSVPAGWEDDRDDTFYAVAERLRIQGPEGEAMDDDNISVDSDRGHPIEIEEPEQRDFRRAKRFKRLKRMLTSVQAQGTIHRLRVSTYLSCLVIFIVHVIVFGVGINAVERHKNRVQNGLSVIGDMMASVQGSLVYSLTVAQRLSSGQGFVASSATNAINQIHDFETYFKILVKGMTKGGFTLALDRLTTDPTATFIFPPPSPIDNSSVLVEYQNTWSLQRELFRHVNVVNQAPKYALFNQTNNGYDYNTSVLFLLDVGSTTLISQLNNAFLDVAGPVCLKSLLGVVRTELASVTVEGVLIVPICALILYVCIKLVMAARYSMFSLFVLLPRPLILNLATKEIRLDEDDSDDEVDEDLEFDRQRLAKDALKNDGEEEKGLRGWKIQIDPKLAKKKLKATPNYNITFKILGPFSVFVGLLIIYVCTVTATMQAEIEPISAMVASQKLYMQASRIRLLTFMYFHNMSAPGDTGVADRMSDAITQFQSSYTELVTGSRGTEPTTLRKAKFKRILFATDCLRKSEPCVGPDNFLYDVTHSGLAGMAQQYVLAAQRILELPPTQLSESLNDYILIQQIGRLDLADGLSTFKTYFLEDSLKGLSSIEILMIVLLIIVFCILIAAVLILRPFLMTINAEAHRVAELLSHVPEEINIEQLVDSLTQNEEEDDDETTFFGRLFGKQKHAAGDDEEAQPMIGPPKHSILNVFKPGATRVHDSHQGQGVGSQDVGALMLNMMTMMRDQMQRGTPNGKGQDRKTRTSRGY